MKFRSLTTAFFSIIIILLFAVPGFSQKLKIGYVHSQKILAEYKEAIDAQKKLDEIIRQWDNEGLEMQQQLQKMREQYDAQSLLLSDTKKREKEQEIQNLFLQLQKFQRDKYDPQSGEVLRKQQEFIQPVLDKINEVIQKIGEEQQFDYIFDTANGGILHASKEQPDLTDSVIEELNKGQSVKKESSKEKDK